MIERQVKCVVKDKDGDILKIGNDGEWWSPKDVADAISDIESGIYQYYVKVGDQKVLIHVVPKNGKKYLQTNPDDISKNNLDNLPSCD